MKKFKSLVYVLALALIFVGAASVTKASAAEPTQNESNTQGGESTQGATITPTVEYAKEQIKVTAEKQVYYQIVKAADNKSGLKTANWIKAAKGADGYYIDFSATANSKDAFFALTTDSTKGDAEAVVTVDAVIKSVKVGLNYKTETISAEKGLADIIASLNVKGVDKANDSDKLTAADYQLKWKRGANGTWKAAADFSQLEWDMLKASNGTLYIAIDGFLKEGSLVDKGFRMSKEAKVKIPKSAKAPTVKVDYVKGTIALKNGMQVRVNDGTNWMDVVAYDKNSAGTDVFALATKGATTKTKVSSVTVADFVKAVEDASILNQGTAVADGATVALTVRTAATAKKFPSMEGTVSFVLPKAAPTVKENVAVTYTKANKEAKVAAAYELDFSKLFTKADDTKYSDYEYVFTAKTEDGLNLAKQKWTKLPESGKVDLAKYIGKDYKYFKATDEKTATGLVKYEAIKAVYIRLAAVKATKTEAGVFASAYGTATVTVTENVPAAKEFTLTSDSTNAAAATFKVDGKAVTKAAKDATVVIEYTPSSSSKVIDTVTYTVEGKNTPVTVNAEQGKYSFKMPEGNVTVTVNEKAQEPQAPTTYTLKADAEGAAVTFTVEDSAVTAAAEGATVVIEYSGELGIASVTYTVEGNETPVTVEATEGTYSFKMPKGNVTVTVTEVSEPSGGEE